MVFKWREQHTPLFLKHFRKYPCLWNTRNESYRDPDQRLNAIRLLTEDLDLEGVTEEAVRLKIKTIRTRYAAEVAKVQQSKQKGDDLYVPKLFWFRQADAFLKAFCSPRNKSLQHAIKKEARIRNYEQTDQSQADDSSGQRESTTCRKRKEKPMEEPEPVKRRHTEESDENEFDLFCKSLAVQLKKMPLERALVCQERLQSVMVQERLGAISGAEGSYQDRSSCNSPRSGQSPIFVEPAVGYSFKTSPQSDQYDADPI